jgi:hypothetical protein
MKAKQATKLWKYSGVFLLATGILHSFVGIAMSKNELWGIVKDGLFNVAKEGDLATGLAFWFLVCGIIIIFFGHTLHHYIKKEQKPAPKFLGCYLLGMSVIGCIIMPVSGFWLFIPQALIIIFAKSK